MQFSDCSSETLATRNDVATTTVFPCDLTFCLGRCTHLTNILFWWTLFRLIGQFTTVLALYDPFGVGVPLNFDITHTHTAGSTRQRYQMHLEDQKRTNLEKEKEDEEENS